jgi:hypothetical protein
LRKNIRPAAPFQSYDGQPKGLSAREPSNPRPGLRVSWDPDQLGRWSMTFVPVMWTIWAILFVLMAVLFLYRYSIAKNEEDQIFLDESFNSEKLEQEAIVSRITKLEPWIKVSQWLVAAMTVVVLVYYIRDILLKLNIIGS